MAWGWGIPLLLCLVASVSSLDQFPILGHEGSNSRPNIVFILTDDQDLHLNSLEYMPLLQKYITDKGTTYKRHYCTTAICCPSRVSLWTGKNSHNTNVTDVHPPYGGYPKFISQGLNEKYLPVWLREAGYNTYYTGKLFNAHSVDTYNKPFPSGWTGSDFLLDPFTYQYLNATTQRNQDPPVSWEGHYSTDVIANKTYGFLEDGIKSGKPFFLTSAIMAPHANVAIPDSLTGPIFTAPIPAERHKDLFPHAKVPRTTNFNPSKPQGVSWIKDLPRLNDTVIEYNDGFYRARLQALQAVDELVEGIVQRLDKAGILDNTYVIFSTDNGYHIGQHRLNPGKECGFEEDINIPLIIRGPGVPVGKVTDAVTAHTDLAPTFVKIAGGPLRDDFDGNPIPLNAREIKAAHASRQEHVNVEFWGNAIPEGAYGYALDEGHAVGLVPNNTYKGLRIIGKRYNIYYSVWCNNEHELYDLNTDPYQTKNLYPRSLSPMLNSNRLFVAGLPAELYRLIPRLDALLMVTKSCKGSTCVDPWGVLHPAGNVATLEDALDRDYDTFYSYVGSRVSFDKCELGYIVESEGPQRAFAFGVDFTV